FVPLLPLRSEKTHFTFTWRSVLDIWSKNKRFFIPEVVDNFMEDTGVVLSIFIYIKLMSVTQVGIIGTLTSAAVIVFTLSIGRISDGWNRPHLLRIGAVLVSLTWLVNAVVGGFVPNQWFFYIATIINTLAVKTFLVPYQSFLMNAARKDDAQFIVLREIPVILGRIIMYSLALVLFNNLPILFVITACLFIYFWFLDSRRLAILGS
ncbi:MAG: hypothetical protein KGI59_03255, partial [Patescibacteria group bacterium]|nr:hypothetical protein [Patescibacteria group bacterium]